MSPSPIVDKCWFNIYQQVAYFVSFVWPALDCFNADNKYNVISFIPTSFVSL